MEISSIRPSVDVSAATSSTPVVRNSSPETMKLEKVEGFQPKEKKEPIESQKENAQKNEEKVREAVDKINKAAVIFDRSLRFQVHEATHRTMVSVIDTVSDKVIRQIPTEEVLDLVAKMNDFIGIIFDKKA